MWNNVGILGYMAILLCMYCVGQKVRVRGLDYKGRNDRSEEWLNVPLFGH